MEQSFEAHAEDVMRSGTLIKGRFLRARSEDWAAACFPHCRMTVQAYSPLGKGTKEVIEDKTVSAVAQRVGKTNAQV